MTRAYDTGGHANGTPAPSAPPTEGPSGFPAKTAAIMLVLCSIWGANFVAIKLGNQGFPPLFAAAVRSTGAALLVALWATATRRRILVDRRRLLDGVVMGALFSLEFVFLYWGTSYTTASRSVLLMYTSPFWVALGAHFLLPNDRLSWLKVGGLALSFAGVAAVFRAPAGSLGSSHLVGDAMEVLGGFFWAISTLYVKRTMPIRPMTTFQVLFYQLAFSAPILWMAALIFKSGGGLSPSLGSAAALAYQTIIVATMSYLVWFWLMRSRHVSQLHSFTFFAPLFGVVFGGIFLGDPLPLLLWAGLALVATGTYLVNAPRG
ncbi:MAG: DMT family transporter [Thermoleophilia bacterium]